MFEEFKKGMVMEFEITDIWIMSYYLEIEVKHEEYYLGIEVKHEEKGIFISQQRYTNRCLKDPGMIIVG